MRFVRAYTDPGNELVLVLEWERPFPEGHKVSITRADKTIIDLEEHELGLADDFVVTGRDANGEPYKPAAHLFERLQRDRQSGEIRAKPGLELPAFHDCPTSLERIRQRLRERGIPGIPVLARAWLTLMLPPDDVEAMGIGRGIPISALKALDAMRVRRDPSVGSRAFVFERQAQRLSDERAAAQVQRAGTTSPPVEGGR